MSTKIFTIFRVALLATLSSVLLACGGGTGGVGDIPVGSGLPTLTLTVVSAGTSQQVNSLGAGQTATAKATVLDAEGKPLAGVIVTFAAADATLLDVVPTSGSALTDASGTAVVTIAPKGGNAGGATTLTASATINGRELKQAANLAIAVSPPGGTGLKVVLSLRDANDAVLTSITAGQQATVKAVVTGSGGSAVQGAVVKFAVGDSALVDIIPAATALTDSAGIAKVFIKSKTINSSGASKITATASTVNEETGEGTVNFSIGAASFQLGAMTFSAQVVPAFNTITVSLPVSNNGQPATGSVPIVLTSSCVTAGKSVISEGTLNAGVYTASYTNNGCLLGTDTVTAQLGAASVSGNVSVLGANIGSIRFISSDPSDKSIVLRGSGGLGRKESALLVFQVVDQNNTGLSGVVVNFATTTNTGGLTLEPKSAVSDASGNVSTTISSGTIPTPVKVIASASRNGQTLSGLSDALAISTGLPIQRNMSLSVLPANIEGLLYDGVTLDVTLLMADQYGNPVSDGTTANFIVSGGAIGTSDQGACQMLNGGCTVKLRSQDFRPSNGRVTILAYAQGIKNFLDLDGNGLFTCPPGGFTDANGNGRFDIDEGKCQCSGTSCEFVPARDDLADAFLSVDASGITDGTTNSNYKPENGDRPVPFNSATWSASGSGSWGVNYIRRSTVITFSGSFAEIQLIEPAIPEIVFNSTNCSAKTLSFRINDGNIDPKTNLANPMPSGTAISAIDAVKVTVGTFFPATVPSSNTAGGTLHSVAIKPDDTSCLAGAGAGSFSLVITSPKNNAKSFPFTVLYKK
jgi:hypothetical protein